MTFELNQKEIGNVVGMLDQSTPNNTYAMMVSQKFAGTLKAGDAVKLDSAGLVLNAITSVTVDTDTIYGFVPYSTRENEYIKGDPINICGIGTTIWLKATTAITIGAKLQWDTSNDGVKTKSASNTIIGLAKSSATVDDLVAVQLVTPTL